jgi:hypothetical protein
VIYLPSGEQMPQQARNFAADSFRAACEFDGIGVPSIEDVLAALDRRVESARRLPRTELRSVRGPVSILILEDGVAVAAPGWLVPEWVWDVRMFVPRVWAAEHNLHFGPDEPPLARPERGDVYLRALHFRLRRTEGLDAVFVGDDATAARVLAYDEVRRDLSGNPLPEVTPGHPGHAPAHGVASRRGVGRPRASHDQGRVEKGGKVADEGRFTFLYDRDGTLLRWDQSMVSDVWWPDARIWHRYQLNPFEASVTSITPQRAQELAGADLYAPVDEDVVRIAPPRVPGETD